MATHDVLHGIGVSAGTAAAPAAIVQPAPGVDTTEPGSVDAAADGARVREALAAVSARLSDRAANAPEETKAILKATAQLAGDRGLAKAVDKKLKKGLGVTQAVHDAVEDYAQMLRSLGGYMAERATDLYDVRDRAICELRGLPEPGVPAFDGPVVLVARDLAPAETATLNPETVLGIITEVGGPTSHTAILAAQLGIPAIVKAEGIMAVEEGTMLALDGGVGEVIVAPTDDEVDLLKERSRRRALALAGSTGKGATYDGYPVKLLANIGTVDDAMKASKFDLEGSGLFRTEFLFLERSEAPTLEEQTDTYTKVLQAFGDRRVVVRTLDAGADKPLSFADLGAEENPALGVRGLRLCQVREDLIDTQLQALAAAHKATGAELWVMAPMVSTADEAKWFADKARGYGLPKVGIMIEVPAAALRAEQLLSIVDFASIGTNDLTQYTMAADRLDGNLAPLLDPWQPAVLEMIRHACNGGRATGKPIGVCGEAGGDPLLALVLTGLGVASLSMAPSKVNAVRAALRMHDLATCQQMAAFAVDAPSAKEGRENVLTLVAPALLDLVCFDASDKQRGGPGNNGVPGPTPFVRVLYGASVPADCVGWVGGGWCACALLRCLGGSTREERGEDQDDAEDRDRADPEDRQIEVRDVGLGDEESAHHAHQESPHERTDAHAPAGGLGHRAYIDGDGRCTPRGVSARSGCPQGLLSAGGCPGLVPPRSRLTRGGRIEGRASARAYRASGSASLCL